jgi:hypothetical protein
LCERTGQSRSKTEKRSRNRKRGERTVVAKQELAVDAVNRDRFGVLPLLNEVETRIRRVEEPLSVERLEVDNLEAFGAPDAEFRFEEVDGGRFGGDVKFLLDNRRVSKEKRVTDEGKKRTLKTRKLSLLP